MFANDPVDSITDFVAGTDFLQFQSGSLTAGTLAAVNYAETAAADYTAALVAANAAMSLGVVDVVSVQVGTGVYVFFDDDGTTSPADSVVFLANTTLAQIDAANIKVVV